MKDFIMEPTPKNTTINTDFIMKSMNSSKTNQFNKLEQEQNPTPMDKYDEMLNKLSKKVNMIKNGQSIGDSQHQ